MGSSGVTGDSNGLNIASMMTGMAIGNTVGQNIAGTINSAMNGSSAIPVPTPIPSEIYHVVIDGKSNGPFDMAAIRQMIVSGQIKKETLIWKAGMSDWVQADNVEELKSSFVNVPPELPV